MYQNPFKGIKAARANVKNRITLLESMEQGVKLLTEKARQHIIDRQRKPVERASRFYSGTDFENLVKMALT